MESNQAKFETIVTNKSFCSVVCLDCEESIELQSEHGNIEIKKGESIFLQANYGKVLFQGTGELLITTV